jgi:hypothetical protein
MGRCKGSPGAATRDRGIPGRIIMTSSALRMRLSLLAASVLVSGALQMIGASPVGAAGPLQCQISMQLAMRVVPLTNKVEFTVASGGGSCFADGQGTYVAQVIAGSGSSKGFGPGSDCPSEETRNFSLDLNLSLTSTSTGLVKTTQQTLSVPGVAALPGSTPVVVSSTGETEGAGDLSYRIYHQCPPGGENSALFVGTLAN